ncbi:hypothetical protein S83_020247 [Arachis hypogaea]|nr:uncharacterized protein DS421_6g195100 [Arachis hypogaea]
MVEKSERGKRCLSETCSFAATFEERWLVIRDSSFPSYPPPAAAKQGCCGIQFPTDQVLRAEGGIQFPTQKNEVTIQPS